MGRKGKGRGEKRVVEVGRGIDGNNDKKREERREERCKETKGKSKLEVHVLASTSTG